MKIKLYHYKIPLSLPITSNASYTRDGLILFLQDKGGSYGIGEIAPLENLSRETIKDCIKQVKAISEIIEKQNIEDISKRCYPSVRFGLELAALSLEANKKEKSLFELLNKNNDFCEDKRVRLNALLTRQNINELEKLLGLGYSSFKIKIRAEEDLKLVKQARYSGGWDIEIRLDANRSFSLDKGIRFGKKVYPLQIAYIEDPVTTGLKDFFYQTGIGIGIDQGIEFKEIRYGMHIKAWIIKPGIVGGIRESIALIKEALSLGILPVLSNPFYSGVGVSALICLSSAFIDKDIAVGFDPYRWIKEDILEEPLEIKEGSFFLKEVLKKMLKINMKNLNLLFSN